MNKFPVIFRVIFFVLLSSCVYSQNQALKEYSYSELFQMIEQEKDTVFVLKDANIVFNEETDKRFSRVYNSLDSKFQTQDFETIKIDKELNFNNVNFFTNFVQEFINNDDYTIEGGFMSKIQFSKNVFFDNLFDINFGECTFMKGLFINRRYYDLSNHSNENQHLGLALDSCSFHQETYIQLIDSDATVIISNCVFNSKSSLTLFVDKVRVVYFTENTFEFSNRELAFWFENVKYLTFIDNFINSQTIELRLYQEEQAFDFLMIENNIFPKHVFLDLNSLKPNFIIPWAQFENKIISRETNDEYRLSILDKPIAVLKDSLFTKDEKTFNREIAFRSVFYHNYKSVFNKKEANAVYKEIKDLETRRLGYLFQENPSFKSFFTWKINRFLKVFSAYGTEPALAVIFSMYVILIFALFYAFFPNTWESDQRKGWVQRFSFFQNYMLNNEGIHTIYLNKKNQKMSSYQEFIENIEKTKLELPMFFVSWTKPLYRASMLSTMLTTKLLKKGDILSGKWQDLSKNQKRIKSFQIGVLIIFSLFYDLLIKLLNALTLSINMFSTLGFGEIPIKGIPRYLAIIQGFIGWFMLTIFSVSLISQLLG